MDDKNIWEKLPLYLSTFAAVVSAFCAGLLLYYSHEQKQYQKGSFIQTLDETFARHYDFICQHFDIEPQVNIRDKKELQKLLDFFEGIDYFLEEGLIDKELVYQFYGHYLQVIYKHPDVKKLITDSRKKPEDKDTYAGFEHLVELTKDSH